MARKPRKPRKARYTKKQKAEIASVKSLVNKHGGVMIPFGPWRYRRADGTRPPVPEYVRKLMDEAGYVRHEPGVGYVVYQHGRPTGVVYPEKGPENGQP